jgi:hypothetical protein
MPTPMTDRSETAAQPTRRSAATRQRQSARKLAAERQRRQTLMVRLGLAAAAVVVVAIAGIVIYTRSQTDASLPAGTKTFNYVGAQHSTDPVKYAEHPPVGGVHNPVWQNCGFYTAPVGNEHAVHSLEHGAVWITYAPDLPQAQVDALRALAERQSYILVSPMEDLPSPVVASAWNHQVALDSANDPRLEQFVREFRLSPQAPEPGAACTGGTPATV